MAQTPFSIWRKALYYRRWVWCIYILELYKLVFSTVHYIACLFQRLGSLTRHPSIREDVCTSWRKSSTCSTRCVIYILVQNDILFSYRMFFHYSISLSLWTDPSPNSFIFQGEHFGTTEATEAFFAMTRLFQSNDVRIFSCSPIYWF